MIHHIWDLLRVHHYAHSIPICVRYLLLFVIWLVATFLREYTATERSWVPILRIENIRRFTALSLRHDEDRKGNIFSHTKFVPWIMLHKYVQFIPNTYYLAHHWRREALQDGPLIFRDSKNYAFIKTSGEVCGVEIVTCWYLKLQIYFLWGFCITSCLGLIYCHILFRFCVAAFVTKSQNAALDLRFEAFDRFVALWVVTLNLYINLLSREELVFIEGDQRDALFLSHSKKTTYFALKVLFNVHERVANLAPHHNKRSLMA